MQRPHCRGPFIGSLKRGPFIVSSLSLSFSATRSFAASAHSHEKGDPTKTRAPHPTVRASHGGLPSALTPRNSSGEGSATFSVSAPPRSPSANDGLATAVGSPWERALSLLRWMKEPSHSLIAAKDYSVEMAARCRQVFTSMTDDDAMTAVRHPKWRFGLFLLRNILETQQKHAVTTFSLPLDRRQQLPLGGAPTVATPIAHPGNSEGRLKDDVVQHSSSGVTEPTLVDLMLQASLSAGAWAEAMKAASLVTGAVSSAPRASQSNLLEYDRSRLLLAVAFYRHEVQEASQSRQKAESADAPNFKGGVGTSVAQLIQQIALPASDGMWKSALSRWWALDPEIQQRTADDVLLAIVCNRLPAEHVVAIWQRLLIPDDLATARTLYYLSHALLQVGSDYISQAGDVIEPFFLRGCNIDVEGLHPADRDALHYQRVRVRAQEGLWDEALGLFMTMPRSTQVQSRNGHRQRSLQSGTFSVHLPFLVDPYLRCAMEAAQVRVSSSRDTTSPPPSAKPSNHSLALVNPYQLPSHRMLAFVTLLEALPTKHALDVLSNEMMNLRGELLAGEGGVIAPATTSLKNLKTLDHGPVGRFRERLAAERTQLQERAVAVLVRHMKVCLSHDLLGAPWEDPTGSQPSLSWSVESFPVILGGDWSLRHQHRTAPLSVRAFNRGQLPTEPRSPSPSARQDYYPNRLAAKSRVGFWVRLAMSTALEYGNCRLLDSFCETLAHLVRRGETAFPTGVQLDETLLEVLRQFVLCLAEAGDQGAGAPQTSGIHTSRDDWLVRRTLRIVLKTSTLLTSNPAAEATVIERLMGQLCEMMEDYVKGSSPTAEEGQLSELMVRSKVIFRIDDALNSKLDEASKRTTAGAESTMPSDASLAVAEVVWTTRKLPKLLLQLGLSSVRGLGRAGKSVVLLPYSPCDEVTYLRVAARRCRPLDSWAESPQNGAPGSSAPTASSKTAPAFYLSVAGLALLQHYILHWRYDKTGKSEHALQPDLGRGQIHSGKPFTAITEMRLASEGLKVVWEEVVSQLCPEVKSSSPEPLMHELARALRGLVSRLKSGSSASAAVARNREVALGAVVAAHRLLFPSALMNAPARSARETAIHAAVQLLTLVVNDLTPSPGRSKNPPAPSQLTSKENEAGVEHLLREVAHDTATAFLRDSATGREWLVALSVYEDCLWPLEERRNIQQQTAPSDLPPSTTPSSEADLLRRFGHFVVGAMPWAVALEWSAERIHSIRREAEMFGTAEVSSRASNSATVSLLCGIQHGLSLQLKNQETRETLPHSVIFHLNHSFVSAVGSLFPRIGTPTGEPTTTGAPAPTILLSDVQRYCHRMIRNLDLMSLPHLRIASELESILSPLKSFTPREPSLALKFRQLSCMLHVLRGAAIPVKDDPTGEMKKSLKSTFPELWTSLKLDKSEHGATKEKMSQPELAGTARAEQRAEKQKPAVNLSASQFHAAIESFEQQSRPRVMTPPRSSSPPQELAAAAANRQAERSQQKKFHTLAESGDWVNALALVRVGVEADTPLHLLRRATYACSLAPGGSGWWGALQAVSHMRERSVPDDIGSIGRTMMLLSRAGRWSDCVKLCATTPKADDQLFSEAIYAVDKHRRDPNLVHALLTLAWEKRKIDFSERTMQRLFRQLAFSSAKHVPIVSQWLEQGKVSPHDRGAVEAAAMFLRDRYVGGWRRALHIALQLHSPKVYTSVLTKAPISADLGKRIKHEIQTNTAFPLQPEEKDLLLCHAAIDSHALPSLNDILGNSGGAGNSKQ